MSDEPIRLRDPAAGETEIVRDVLGAGDDFGPTPEGLDRVAARLAVVLPPGAFPKPVVTPHAIAPIVKMIAGAGFLEIWRYDTWSQSVFNELLPRFWQELLTSEE